MNAYREVSPESLVHGQVAGVYRLCRRMLGNEADAQECAQEALLRAVERLPSFRGDSSVTTWVYRITVNVCRNHRRHTAVTYRLTTGGKRSTVEDEIPLVGEYPTPEQVTLKREAILEVTRAVDGLPVRQRVVVILREMEEMSYEEIAEVLSIPVGTVRSTLFRARRTLAESLKGVWP